MNEFFLVVNFLLPKNYIIVGIIRKGMNRMEVSTESPGFFFKLI